MVGAMTETDHRSAAWPRSVDTTSGTLKAVVDQQRIESLPLNGRNPTALLQTLSSACCPIRTSLTSGATYPGSRRCRRAARAATPPTTSWTADRTTITTATRRTRCRIPDALQEFSVQTNNFWPNTAATSARSSTPSRARARTRFHGLAFGYLRDHKLNATNFFTPGVDDGLKRKQYGGTFGGAIEQNRTFFFSSYQGTNQEQRPLRAARRWSRPRRMRAGDFSSLSRQLRNPSTGQPFAGNQIPSTLLNPVATEDPQRTGCRCRIRPEATARRCCATRCRSTPTITSS